MDDWQLLREYADTGSESAFSQLVQRHLDWVYGVCRRRVTDPALAEDVTQAVFIVLSKKASQLGERVVLVGWLMNAIHFAVADALKRQARRRQHERKAAEMKQANTSNNVHPADLELSSQVDVALNQLPSTYRDAIALRFYRQQSYAEIASVLGVNEETAKKRVSRGLEKLRSLLKGRVGSITVMTLSAALAAAAPAGLHAQVISATAGKATAALAIANGTMQIMALGKVKIAFPVAIAALGIAGVSALVCQIVVPIGSPIATVTHAQPKVPVSEFLITAGSAGEAAENDWRAFDRSLLRFTDSGGAFEHFHLSIPIQALPARDIAPSEVIVERNGKRGTLLVLSSREALPYAYVGDDFFLQIDPETPNSVIVALNVGPQLLLCADGPGRTITHVSVAVAESKHIDVDLGSLMDRLRAHGAQVNRDDARYLRFHSVTAGGRFALDLDAEPGNPPVCGFNVTEQARLAVQVRDIEVTEASTKLPRLTLKMIEDSELSVRRISARDAQRDLLPPARFFDNQQHRLASTKLQALLLQREQANKHSGRLAALD